MSEPRELTACECALLVGVWLGIRLAYIRLGRRFEANL